MSALNAITRVLGPHQNKAKHQASSLLLATGLGGGKVAGDAVVQQNQSQLRSGGMPPEDARRFRETYVVAYLDDEMVGAARYFPDLSWAAQSIQKGAPLSDLLKVARQPRLSHLAVVPSLRGQGIGTLLLTAAEHEARRDGNEMLWGFAEASVEPGRKPTLAENTQLFTFYSRCGYTIGGSAEHAPVEIFGQPVFSVHSRVGKYFWKVL